MPGVHRVDLIGQEVVAWELGVTSQAISNWYARDLPGLPVATLVQYNPGKPARKVWRRAQLGVWRKWHAVHLEQAGVFIPGRRS